MVLGAVTLSPAGFLVAFGAGITSFLSPCVLPLVPGYCSMVTGLSTVTLGDPHHRARVVGAMGSFVGGFTVVFVLLGAAASSVGRALQAHKGTLQASAGVVVLAFGLALCLATLPEGAWRRLGTRSTSAAIAVTRERRLSVARLAVGPFGGFVVGAAFAFAWTPCIGPVLGAVLAYAAQSSTVVGGMGLLAAYSLGLAVPFLAAGLFVDQVAGFARRHGRVLALLQVVGAVVLIAFGIALLTGQVSWIASRCSALLTALHLGSLTSS